MSGIDQETANGTSHGETCNLGGKNQEHASNESLVGMVPDLLQNDDIDGVSGSGVAGNHSSDQDVLLDGEGARVKRPLVTEKAELAGGQDAGHEHTHGKREQSADRVTKLDLNLAKIEELVDKGDNASPQQSEEPHAESVTGDGRVIGVWKVEWSGCRISSLVHRPWELH